MSTTPNEGEGKLGEGEGRVEMLTTIVELHKYHHKIKQLFNQGHKPLIIPISVCVVLIFETPIILPSLKISEGSFFLTKWY